jgi:acetolactate synthase I/III small subunit
MKSDTTPLGLTRSPMPPRTRHVFVAYVEDVPGVLSRVSGLFRRRGYNIESLTVGQTEEKGISRMTIVVLGDDTTARLMEANLYKLVNVIRVKDVTYTPSVTRDLALIKVRAPADAKTQVMQVVEVFRARVVDVSPEALVVEITGTEDKIQGLVQVLEPFGIIEMVQTGVVAMTRGPESIRVKPRSTQALAEEAAQAEEQP